jgi:putative tryptophan/tyrosine transport system substrate-binding protein
MWTVHVAKFISFPSTWRVECPHTSVTQEAIMTRRTVGLLAIFALAFLVMPLAAAAQPAGKVPRIGVIMQGVPPGASGDELDVFRQGLWDRGYVEGQTIALEVRWGEGQHEQYPALAADLVRLSVDLIVAAGGSPARAAQHATTTIPIVMLVGDDPVAQGLVASLARPGGNVTGLTVMTRELSEKRLELLQEAGPGLSNGSLCGMLSLIGYPLQKGSP